jgi:hypothetical protein
MILFLALMCLWISFAYLAAILVRRRILGNMTVLAVLAIVQKQLLKIDFEMRNGVQFPVTIKQVVVTPTRCACCGKRSVHAGVSHVRRRRR